MIYFDDLFLEMFFLKILRYNIFSKGFNGLVIINLFYLILSKGSLRFNVNVGVDEARSVLRQVALISPIK